MDIQPVCGTQNSHWAQFTWQSHSVMSRGLPLHGWAALVPKYFHFPRIPLAVDYLISGKEETSWTYLLQKRYPITIPRLDSVSSLERQILWQTSVKQTAWLNALFHTHLAMKINTRIQRLRGAIQYFCPNSVNMNKNTCRALTVFYVQ